MFGESRGTIIVPDDFLLPREGRACKFVSSDIGWSMSVMLEFDEADMSSSGYEGRLSSETLGYGLIVTEGFDIF